MIVRGFIPYEELVAQVRAEIEADAARYAAAEDGQDDLAGLSPLEIGRAAIHLAFHRDAEAIYRSKHREKSVKDRKAQGLSTIPGDEFLRTWFACAQDFPKLTATDIDEAIGEDLKVSERTVRARRLELGYRGTKVTQEMARVRGATKSR